MGETQSSFKRLKEQAEKDAVKISQIIEKEKKEKILQIQKMKDEMSISNEKELKLVNTAIQKIQAVEVGMKAKKENLDNITAKEQEEMITQERLMEQLTNISKATAEAKTFFRKENEDAVQINTHLKDVSKRVNEKLEANTHLKDVNKMMNEKGEINTHLKDVNKKMNEALEMKAHVKDIDEKMNKREEMNTQLEDVNKKMNKERKI